MATLEIGTIVCRVDSSNVIVATEAIAKVTAKQAVTDKGTKLNRDSQNLSYFVQIGGSQRVYKIYTPELQQKSDAAKNAEQKIRERGTLKIAR